MVDVDSVGDAVVGLAVEVSGEFVFGECLFDVGVCGCSVVVDFEELDCFVEVCGVVVWLGVEELCGVDELLFCCVVCFDALFDGCVDECS